MFGVPNLSNEAITLAGTYGRYVHRAGTPNEKHHRSGTRIYVEGNCQLNSIILWVDYVLAKRMIYD